MSIVSVILAAGSAIMLALLIFHPSVEAGFGVILFGLLFVAVMDDR